MIQSMLLPQLSSGNDVVRFCTHIPHLHKGCTRILFATSWTLEDTFTRVALQPDCHIRFAVVASDLGLVYQLFVCLLQILRRERLVTLVALDPVYTPLAQMIAENKGTHRFSLDIILGVYDIGDWSLSAICFLKEDMVDDSLWGPSPNIAGGR